MNKPDIVLADKTADLTDLQKDPMATVASANGKPIAIQNDGQAVFYCIPTETWRKIYDKLEDIELASLVNERSGDKSIEINLDDLE